MGTLNGSLQEPLIDSQAEVSTGTLRWRWGETKEQMRLAGPMVCAALLQYMLPVASSIFVEQLGSLELASTSVAISFTGTIGTNVVLGLASSLDSLYGPAFGARRYRMLGIYMQRGILVLNLMAVLFVLGWWNLGLMLVHLGEDPEISNMAGLYARDLIPSIFANAIVQPLMKFLQAQSIVVPVAIFSFMTLLLHILLCWLLIFYSGVGYLGAAIATSISSWFNVFLFAWYVRFSSACKRTWTGFSPEAFNDLAAFVRLAILSAATICLNFRSLAALLPNPQLEASTLAIATCLFTVGLLYNVSSGVGAAASTRVGNELGAGRPDEAKGAAMVAVFVSVLEGVVMALLLVLGRSLWKVAFSSNREVMDYFMRCILFVAAVHCMDTLQVVLSGAVRGCGWHSRGACVILAAYYGVGLPASVVLAFMYNFSGRGLWMAMLVGIVAQVIALFAIIPTMNWHQEAADAQVADAQEVDAREADAQVDVRALDSPTVDAPAADAPVADAQVADARVADVLAVDAQAADVWVADGWAGNAWVADVGVVDAQVANARAADARTADAPGLPLEHPPS